MARYGKEHKEATRRRIVEAAGRRFKRDGIDGSGIATLMADAGLTNGAFYAHFASKEDLVATTVADQLREQRETLLAAARAPASSSWCASTSRSGTATTPSTAARRPPCSTRSVAAATSTKQAYTDGVLAIADEIASRLAPDDPAVGARDDAQPLRPADRHAAALSRARRPAARRRGARAGHRERAGARRPRVVVGL